MKPLFPMIRKFWEDGIVGNASSKFFVEPIRQKIFRFDEKWRFRILNRVDDTCADGFSYFLSTEKIT